MSTQKALVVQEVGKPIVVTERPVPEPKDGEIRIKVTVCGLNPYDFRVRDWGLYVEGRLPVVLGNDLAGVVDKLGPGVPADGPLKVGTHVFGQTNYLKGSSDQCGLQALAILDAVACAPVPAPLTDDDGASLVCNLIAPFWAIFGRDGLDLPFPFPGKPRPADIDYARESIVVVGAGSNCGRYGVQSAALAGFGTVVAVASPSKTAALKAEGATHVVDRHAPDAVAQIRAIVGDDLRYAFDAATVDHVVGVSVLSTKRKGTLACIVPGKADPGLVGEKPHGYNEVFIQGQSTNQPELAADYWRCLPRWMAEGKIRATGWDVIKGLDVDKVNALLDDYRDGRQPPKQVHVHF